MSQSRIPPIAHRYFRCGLDDHPLIASTFAPDRGWKRHPYRKRVSGNHLRSLRRQGITHVALSCRGRTADFSIHELLRPATT